MIAHKGGREYEVSAPDVYARLGVRTYINVAGNVTDFGGSIPTERTLRAMYEAAHDYVDVHELRLAVDRRIARLTRNEAAHVTVSASSSVYLTVLSAASAHAGIPGHVPSPHDMQELNVLIPRRCRNPYDIAVRQTGVQLVECDELHLADSATESTIAVLFVPGPTDPMGGDAVQPLIEQVHALGHPLIIDAAARIPPVSSLWDYTSCGTDAVIFSGGKGIAGPQSTGLVVGTGEFLAWMEPFLFPAEGYGRMFKVGREELVGLLVAIECLLERDEQAYLDWCDQAVQLLCREFETDPRVAVSRGYPNAAGQSLPYAHFRVDRSIATASEIARLLRLGMPTVFVAAVPWGSDFTDGFMVNTMTLREEDIVPVVGAIRAALDTVVHVGP
jgi:seryl-tRNA(Sec) selenium transferase